MKRYYLTNRFKLIVACIWSSPLIFITPMFLIFNRDDLWLLLFYGVAQTLGSMYMVYSNKITLSDTGIEYSNGLNSVSTEWEAAESISLGWYLTKQETIIINEPVIKRKTVSISSLLTGSISKNRIPKSFIPLECFADNWRDSELGQQIKQYAPHLFK